MIIPKTTLAATLAVMICLLSGCGRKGPLYIQQTPAKSESATTVPNPIVPTQPEIKK